MSRSGRAGASLRFRLSRSAKVDFRVASARVVGPLLGRFSIRGRKGLNRLRFTGRLRGRALPAGTYRLTAQAIDRTGIASVPATVGFRVR